MRRFGSWPAWLFLAGFFALPLLALVSEAFSGQGEAFIRFLGDAMFWDALRNTVLLGSVAGGLSAVFGTLIALELARSRQGGVSG